jgi:hypothetical protein
MIDNSWNWSLISLLGLGLLTLTFLLFGWRHEVPALVYGGLMFFGGGLMRPWVMR